MEFDGPVLEIVYIHEVNADLFEAPGPLTCWVRYSIGGLCSHLLPTGGCVDSTGGNYVSAVR